MTTDQLQEHEAIAKNKAFAQRLLTDLAKVYTIIETVKDNVKNTVIKLQSSGNYISTASFNANKDGIFFGSDVLGYYEDKTVRGIGKHYERYKEDGTISKDGKDFTQNDHKRISFKIKLTENDPTLPQRLRDVMYLLEHNGFNKKF